MAEHVFFLIFSPRAPLQAIKISQQTEQLLSGTALFAGDIRRARQVV